MRYPVTVPSGKKDIRRLSRGAQVLQITRMPWKGEKYAFDKEVRELLM
jgi:hypothetical protein